MSIFHECKYFSSFAEWKIEANYSAAQGLIQQTQNICITCIQCWANVEDVGPTFYKCYRKSFVWKCFVFAGKVHKMSPSPPPLEANIWHSQPRCNHGQAMARIYIHSYCYFKANQENEISYNDIYIYTDRPIYCHSACHYVSVDSSKKYNEWFRDAVSVGTIPFKASQRVK